MGQAVYERAYYYCSDCRQGHFPTDEELGVVSRQTPAAQELTSLAGVLEPFEEAADDVLPTMSGLNVSASTIRRVTERVGEDMARRRAAAETFGPPQAWDWNRDATGHQVAYVSLDATGVPQQGPQAQKAEGRMPWVWRPCSTRNRRMRQRAAAACGRAAIWPG